VSARSLERHRRNVFRSNRSPNNDCVEATAVCEENYIRANREHGHRQWWVTPKRCRAVVWASGTGRWLMDVNGPRRGRVELAFEKWCGQNGHACVRTVDLFCTVRVSPQRLSQSAASHLLPFEEQEISETMPIWAVVERQSTLATSISEIYISVSL
jgi:hypothetical protein